MQEGLLLMTQADRDRLVTLKKAKKRLITQREAAEELGVERASREADAIPLEEAGRQSRGAWTARETFEAENRRTHTAGGREDSFGSSVRRIRADLSVGVSAQEARDQGEQGDGAAVDDAGQVVAGEEDESQGRPHLAAAPEPVRRAGAMGHQRARLAGGTRRETVPDRDDRRRYQPTFCTVCAERFHSREHAAAVGVRGKLRAAGGILHGQGEPVSDNGEAQTR